MDPELLDLPLGVKIPVLPGSKPVFSRAKLGEKLHRPSGYFNLGDPNCRLLCTDYNSLHDPHLQVYQQRKGNIKRLKREGYLTGDGKVVCTLKEFNEYRQYLKRLKLEAEQRSRREEERLQQCLAVAKNGSKQLAPISVIRLLQPQKPSCPPPPKSKKVSVNARRCRRVRGALDKGQSLPPAELGQEGAKLPKRPTGDTGCEKKPDISALEAEKKPRREKERQRQLQAKVKDALKVPESTDPSSLAEQLLQPQKPSCPPPSKSKNVSLTLEQRRRVRAIVDQSQTHSQTELGQEGAKLTKRATGDPDYERKPDVTALEAEKSPRREKQRLRQLPAKVKDDLKVPESTEPSNLAEGLLQPQKPSYQRPPKSKKISMNAGRCTRVRAAALDKGQSLPPAELGQEGVKLPKRPPGDAGCRRKPDISALEAEKKPKREKERLCQLPAKVKDAPKLPASISASCLAQRLRQPQKPSCPPPAKGQNSSLKVGRCRRVKEALHQGPSHPELAQEDAKLPRRTATGDTGCKGKADGPADGMFTAATEELSAREAQKLEEMAEAVVQNVLQTVKAPGAQSAYILRRAVLGIRESLCASARTAEPLPLESSPLDRQQELGLVAKELVATVLEGLVKRLPQASEPGPAARQKEQPAAGGATRTGKANETKAGQAATAASTRAASLAALDKLIKEVIESVCSTLESFVASQFEPDASCEYSQILELPQGKLSNRPLRPSQMSFSRQDLEEGRGQSCRAPQQYGLEASTGTKLPASQRLPNASAADALRLSRTIARESIQNAISRVEQRHAERAGHGQNVVPPELLATAKQQPESRMKLKPAALASALAIRTMAKRIVASLLEQISRPGPTLTPSLGRRAGKLSCPTAEDALPSMGPQLSRQPILPAGPKPPAQTGAWHRALRITLAPRKPQ